jgi:hypothetical protein
VTEAIESTAEELGTELVVHAQPPTTLFRTEDPVEVLERASRVAQALKGVIDQQKLVSNIQGREHVRVEGWTTLGSMLGVVPVVVWTRRTEDGWEARVEARTMDGRTVGAAEAMCSKAERTWKSRDDYALRSMAQTRATSKALRGPLGFVVTLAGYEATPAEEIPPEGFQDQPRMGSTPATDKQKAAIRREFTRQALKWADIKALFAAASVPVSTEDPRALVDGLLKHQASALLDVLKQGALPTGESDVPVDADAFPPAEPADTDGDGMGGVPWKDNA